MVAKAKPKEKPKAKAKSKNAPITIEQNVAIKIQNIKYYVDVDYDENRDHCDCDSICRCSKIENVRVKGVRYNSVMNYILNGDAPRSFIRDTKRAPAIKTNDINKYVIGRLLVHLCKILNKDSFDVNVVNGYYGEEIGEISLSNAYEFTAKLHEILNIKSPIQKVFKVLKIEYGYILDSIKNKTKAEVIEIPVESIIFGSKDHYVNIDQEKVDLYRGDPGPQEPVGIVAFLGEQYRLIDGYHRVNACIKDGKEKVKVIVLV